MISLETLADYVDQGYPVLLPLFAQEAKLTLSDISSRYDVDRRVLNAWNVLCRDLLMSRAIEAGLLNDSIKPQGGTINQFLTWLSSQLAQHWTVLLSPYEFEERRHVIKVSSVHRHRRDSSSKAV